MRIEYIAKNAFKLPVKHDGNGFRIKYPRSLYIRTRSSNATRWRIQDFPVGGCQPQRRNANLLFGLIFAKNCTKMKNIRLRGGSWIRQRDRLFSQYLLIFLAVVVCCCCSGMLNLVGLWSPPGSAFGSVIWEKPQNISFGKV